MSVPFKVAHFHLNRRNELKAELSRSPLFRAMQETAGLKGLNETLLRNAREGFLLSPGAHAVVDEAVEQLRTFARLSCTTEVRVRRNDTSQLTSLACRDGQTLVFSLPVSLLDGATVPSLVCHLAFATFFVMETTPRLVQWMIKQRVPFHLGDRLKAYELLRLSDYAAECFALTCTVDLELTLRERFHRSGVAGTCRLPIDLRVVAQHHLAAGELTTASMIEADRCRFEYPPITPLVLEQFQASEVYRGCRGKAGGVSRAEFEAKVLEMDRKAHPPLSGLPDSHFRFFKLATTLAAFTVAEATAPVNEARKTEIVEFLGLSAEQFDWVAAELNWDWREAGSAEKRVERLLRNQREQLANLHSVEIIERCVKLALREHGALPEAVADTLDRIGDWSFLTAHEVKEVCKAPMAERPGEKAES